MYLDYNIISNIDVFEFVNFNNLIILSLNNNKITNILPFHRIFEKLQLLNFELNFGSIEEKKYSKIISQLKNNIKEFIY